MSSQSLQPSRQSRELELAPASKPPCAELANEPGAGVYV